MKFIKLLESRKSILKEIYNISRSRYVAEIFKIIFNLINLVVAEIFLDKAIFDTLADRNSNFSFLVFLIILLFITMGSNIAYMHWYNDHYSIYSNAFIKSKIKEKVYEKLSNVDLESYDNPKFYNNQIWISENCDEKYIQILNSFFMLINAAASCVAVVVSAITFEPVLLIFSLIYIIISITVNKVYSKLKFEFEKNSVEIKRKLEYPTSVFYSPQMAKDIRLTGLADLLKNKYKLFADEYIKIINTYGKKLSIFYTFLLLIETLTGTWIPLFYVASKAIITKKYSVGTVSASISVISSLKNSVKNIIEAVGQMQEHEYFIGLYKEFINKKPRIKYNKTGFEAGKNINSLMVEKLKFKYPETHQLILNNINLNIKSGNKIAIVGANGSGKTTLVKLLMRLYLPESGKIYFDGIPEEKYSLNSLQSRFGVIFQDFQLYSLSVAENVMMGNYRSEDKSIVDTAIKKSGIYNRIYKELNNINACLLKEYDDNGIIFSGGQAQKLAVSRVFAKDCGVIIMDEPTASLDPKSEEEMFQNLNKAALGKTVILISHRLSSVKNADYIYFLENGRIVECGNHQQLMANKGEYYKMFSLQASMYGVN